MFSGTVSGVGATETWGSRWHAEQGGPGDTVTGGDDEQHVRDC